MTKEILRHLSGVSKDADDLKAQALYDCCHIDALLEFGRESLATIEVHVPYCFLLLLQG